MFEFIIPRRPLSHQSKDVTNKQKWKDFVYGCAFREWRGTPYQNKSLKFTLVYLCESDPADINNIIKPIQDCLNGLVYPDDSFVVDVDGHMRYLSDPIDFLELPDILRDALILGEECVYVRIQQSKELAKEL